MSSDLTLVRPKSDTFRFHLLSSRRLSDLRSQWATPDEWRKCIPKDAVKRSLVSRSGGISGTIS